jgi:hypothetical protein
MKIIALLVFLITSLPSFAQQDEYHLKSFNPHIQEKEISKIDPRIKVAKDKKSVSLKQIDYILTAVELSEISLKLDNVDRYILGQNCLGRSEDYFLSMYKQYNSNKMTSFCKELKKL